MQDFINGVMEWLNSGVYTFATDATAFMIKKAVISYITFLYKMIPFAWGVAQSIMNDLNVSAYLNSAWGSLDSTTRSIATFLKLPEGVNFILSAAMTKFVMKFIPGF